jgi:anthranilate synthase component 2
MKTLIIDNYDSFTFNLYQCIGELGGGPVVYRNDKLTLEEARALAPTHIVISPGPGDPRDTGYFGVCADVIRALGPTIPLLGVCLGHQGIGHVFGGQVVRAPEIMHGKTSPIRHHGESVFAGLPSPLTGMRYHSLLVDRGSLPADLKITAETEDGLIMGLRHVRHPIHGIQFHPESVGTETGKQMLDTFLHFS